MGVNLFSNPVMDDITGEALFRLVKTDSIKLLMTDLFIIMLENKAFEEDVRRLLNNLIRDYLNTDHCRDNLARVVREQAWRNEQHVHKGL
jgi:hypothetical protein